MIDGNFDNKFDSVNFADAKIQVMNIGREVNCAMIDMEEEYENKHSSKKEDIDARTQDKAAVRDRKRRSRENIKKRKQTEGEEVIKAEEKTVNDSVV